MDNINIAPEKASGNDTPLSKTYSVEAGTTEKIVGDDDFEVFKRNEGQVDYRTVGWLKATLIFLKLVFATGVLSIPAALYTLGAVPGGINIVGWCILNTYAGVIFGNFRNRHAGCHSVADMAGIVGGPWMREAAGVLFVMVWVICASSGIIGASTALNVLSTHALCTNWFSLIATIIVATAASMRKLESISWLSAVGFCTVFVAIMVVVVGVTTLDRPATAPQTGPYDLGFRVIGHPDFAAGITSAAAIFAAGSFPSAMLPVLSEMRNPKEFKKPLYISMSIVTASYLSLSMVIFVYCGKWIASPSLGSAGPRFNKAAYGIALVSLFITACIWIHVAAKYCFVRLLRGTKHLQQNSATHFATWFGCTFGLSAIAFVIAAGIPIFNYILSLAGALGFAPLTIVLPASLWIYENKEYRWGTLRQKTWFLAHCAMFGLGVFVCVGGVYGQVVTIIKAYQDGTIGSAFSCADNSGTV